MSFLGDIADAVGIGTTGVPWATVASLGSAAIAGGMSYAGQQSINDTNIQLAGANNQFNANQAQLNRDFQSQQAQQQMDYQKYMSNTAYRRAVDDMKAAGLNPMLAYQQGGASSPAGASGGGSQAQSAGLPQLGNPAAAGTTAAYQAMEAQRASADVDLKDAQVAKERAAATRDLASAGQLNAQRDKLKRELYELENSWRDDLTGMGRQASFHYQSFADKFRAGILSSEDMEATRYFSARARELSNKADLLGLDVPEAISRAAFWRSPAGHAAPYVEFGTSSIGKVIGSAVQARRAAGMGGGSGITINNRIPR